MRGLWAAGRQAGLLIADASSASRMGNKRAIFRPKSCRQESAICNRQPVQKGSLHHSPDFY
jgi:hypothetical protein